MSSQRGFTLIELMIVVAIIAILAAIAISQYQDYVAKAQLSEAFSIADGLKTKVSEVYTQTAACPANNAAGTGIPAAASITGKYVSQTVTGGDRQRRRRLHPDDDLQGRRQRRARPGRTRYRLYPGGRGLRSRALGLLHRHRRQVPAATCQ